jgi:alpha-tubulin suppressor-like RCC1 family protein
MPGPTSGSLCGGRRTGSLGSALDTRPGKGFNRFKRASINIINVNHMGSKPKAKAASTNKPSGLISFGKNDFGQLGTGDKTDHVQPNEAHFFDDKEVLLIACGQYHTIFTVVDHWDFNTALMSWTVFSRVYGCGKGNWGQYAHGANLGTELPHYACTPVEIIEFAEKSVTQVACGQDFSLFLVDEQLWSCGNNRYGQLGSTERAHPKVVCDPFFKGKRVMSIACGNAHTLVVANRGAEVYCCGRNKWGQLGLGNTTDQTKFVPVPTFDPNNKMNAKKDLYDTQGLVVEIACGAECSFCVQKRLVVTMHVPEDAAQKKEDLIGRRNSAAAVDFECQHEKSLQRQEETEAKQRDKLLEMRRTREAKAEAAESKAKEERGGKGEGGEKKGEDRNNGAEIEEEGAEGGEEEGSEDDEGQRIERKTFAFGRNSYGQLGVGHFRPVTEPTVVARSTPYFNFEEISSGEQHTVARGTDGLYYGWGDNSYGQLGFHHHDFNRKDDHEVEVDFIATTRFGAPTMLEKLNYLEPENVCCGEHHTLAITNSQVISFGSNNCGQLGNYFDDLSDHDVPAIIPDLLPVTSRDQCIDPHRLPPAAVKDGFHHMAAGVSTSYVWKATSFDRDGKDVKATMEAESAAVEAEEEAAVHAIRRAPHDSLPGNENTR